MKSSGRPMVHVGKHKSSSNSCFLSVTERMRSGSSLTSFGAARTSTKARRATLATVVALLLTAAGARAEEHVSGFANLSEPQSTTPLEDWGPVPTDKASIANLAPGLLPFFNNGPVFGLPGTVTGDFWILDSGFLDSGDSAFNSPCETVAARRMAIECTVTVFLILVFHMFGALAEFERSLIRERTQAGLAAARRAGRTGGRPAKLTDDDLDVATTLLANPDITVAEVAQRVGVSPATLYRYLPAARTAHGSPS